jgi:hypothetical protein
MRKLATNNDERGRLIRCIPSRFMPVGRRSVDGRRSEEERHAASDAAAARLRADDSREARVQRAFRSPCRSSESVASSFATFVSSNGSACRSYSSRSPVAYRANRYRSVRTAQYVGTGFEPSMCSIRNRVRHPASSPPSSCSRLRPSVGTGTPATAAIVGAMSMLRASADDVAPASAAVTGSKRTTRGTRMLSS